MQGQIYSLFAKPAPTSNQDEVIELIKESLGSLMDKPSEYWPALEELSTCAGLISALRAGTIVECTVLTIGTSDRGWSVLEALWILTSDF